MRQKKTIKKGGFTLVELAITVAVSSVVILAIGFLLFDSQRSWSSTYDQVNGDMGTDPFVARRAFDAIVRKSSTRRVRIGIDGDSTEVYYYSNPADFNSVVPDRYARFYVSNENQLMVDQGFYNWTTKTAQAASDILLLAKNVSSVDFAPNGAAMQMILELDDGSENVIVTSSPIRHSY